MFKPARFNSETSQINSNGDFQFRGSQLFACLFSYWVSDIFVWQIYRLLFYRFKINHHVPGNSEQNLYHFRYLIFPTASMRPSQTSKNEKPKNKPRQPPNSATKDIKGKVHSSLSTTTTLLANMMSRVQSVASGLWSPIVSTILSGTVSIKIQ